MPAPARAEGRRGSSTSPDVGVTRPAACAGRSTCPSPTSKIRQSRLPEGDIDVVEHQPERPAPEGLGERVAHPAELGVRRIFRVVSIHGELVEPGSSLGERVERSPQQPVHGDDE